MNKEIFVQNVKHYCEKRGVKPTNACKESGVGGSFLSDINRGQTPSVAKVQMLAEYLGVTTSELLGEEKPIPVPGNGLSETAFRVAKAYDKAGEGIQLSVRKLLDVDEAPQESAPTREAM